MARTIALVVGSLRKESFTRRIANAIVKLAPSLTFHHIDISKVSPFDQDLEQTPPPDWVALKEAIQACDAVLFATPEYNRSMPGVLKNAIDVASRPYGKSAWAHKPGAIVSVSPGAIGGFGANHHLRQSLVFLDVPCMQQPEMYLSNVQKMLDDNGEPNEQTRKHLSAFAVAFTEWIERFLPAKH